MHFKVKSNFRKTKFRMIKTGIMVAELKNFKFLYPLFNYY